MRLAIGYASGAGEFTIGLRTSLASNAAAPLAAAVAASVGVTKFPALFLSWNTVKLFCRVRELHVADRSRSLAHEARHALVPLPPIPTGQLTDVFTISFHSYYVREIGNEDVDRAAAVRAVRTGWTGEAGRSTPGLSAAMRLSFQVVILPM